MSTKDWLLNRLKKLQMRENKKHKNIKIGTHKGLYYCPICIRGELW